MNSTFDHLSSLARYPGDDYFDHLHTALAAMPLCEPLRKFAALVAPESIRRLQEQYTRTFDLNPVCAPELGWHLFGETYERGAFLSRMRRELREHDVVEGSELPDHLAYALKLAARMNRDPGEDFVLACLSPAVHRMLRALPEENIFRPLVVAIRESLEMAFPEARDIDVPVSLTVLGEGAME